MKCRNRELNSSNCMSTTKWKVSYIIPSLIHSSPKTEISSPEVGQILNKEISCDFISLLAKRYMEMIVQNILSHLDENSLRSCELVSTTWHSVIHSGRLWQKLYHRVSYKNILLQTLLTKKLMESKAPVVADNLFFKSLFNTQKCVKKLWKTGEFTTTSTYIRADVPLNIFRMDSKRIVMTFDQLQLIGSQRLIMVFNRWTLESQCVLKVLVPDKIIDFELHEELIFCAHAGGNIFVYDLSTENVVLQFQSQDVVGGTEVGLRKVHVALGLLICCLDNRADTYVSIRRIHSSANSSLKLEVESIVNILDARVLQIESDENYFVLFLQSDFYEWTKIQLRSTTDFCVVHELDTDFDVFIQNNARFAYHGGWLVTVTTERDFGYLIEVWDAKTLTCKKQWINPDSAQIFLTSSHLILNHFVGNILSVLELPASSDVGDSGEEIEKKVVKYDILFHYDNDDRVFSVDEFQIFSLTNSFPYMLTAVNFLKPCN